MPSSFSSFDAPPSRVCLKKIPLWIQTNLAHGDEDQRAIAQYALDALMAAANIEPLPWAKPSATMCLHCHQQPATKVEDERGFTLCDACYFQALPDVPPRTAQDRLIAVQTAEILRLTRELAAARNALVGGS